MHADIVGYSRLIGLDDTGTLERLRALRRDLIDPAITEHGGTIVNTAGDALLIMFDSVDGAVRCAVKVQQQVPSYDGDRPTDNHIRFRVGINAGDAIPDGTDLHGDVVNVAARLQAECPPGGICISRAVREHVRGRLDLGFEARGALNLKNIAQPVDVFVWRPDAAAGDRFIERTLVHGTGDALPLPDKPSIAVLPFQNMSGDQEQEYFADGVVEEITTAIARLHWLFVIARNSSFTYKGRSVDVKQVGRELGVRYLLEGSVRKAGSRVRITGQLIDTTGGTHIWAERFDGVLDDIFALQDQVASSVAGAIEPRLKLAEIERAWRKPTNSLDAFDLYLRALAAFRKPGLDNCDTAIVLLQRALGIDPSYAPAAGLIAYVRRHQYVMGVHLSAAEIADALRVARRAVEVGKDDPDALWMGGHTLSLLAGDHATAMSAIEQSITINPNGAFAWWAKGAVNCYVNRPDTAIGATQRAIRLSPLDPAGFQFEHILGFALMLAGRYGEAMNHVDRALRDRPDYHPAMRAKLALCGYLGDQRQGRDYVRRLLEANPAMTITGFEAFVATHHTPETTAVFVEGFRRAGLPEK
jgi:adenylate cyclase